MTVSHEALLIWQQSCDIFMDVVIVTSGFGSIRLKFTYLSPDTSSQSDNMFCPHNDLEAAEKMYSVLLQILF